MKKTNKKGFTLVELVIVIAVIAILAAVLIPTFANLIKKANEAVDISACKNINTVLAAGAVPDGINRIDEVMVALKGEKIELQNYKPLTSGYHYYWIAKDASGNSVNRVVLCNEKDEVIYPEEYKDYSRLYWYSLSGEITAENVTFADSTVSVDSGAKLVSALQQVKDQASEATINLTGTVNMMGANSEVETLSKNLTIMGSGVNSTTLSAIRDDSNVFDGKAGTIYTEQKYGYGMIGSVEANKTVTIKDVTIEGAVINDTANVETSYAGLIVGQLYGNLVLENVKFKDCIVTGESKIGAIVGYMMNGSSIELKNCTFENVKVGGMSYVAKLVGVSQMNNATTLTNIKMDEATFNSAQSGITTFTDQSHNPGPYAEMIDNGVQFQPYRDGEGFYNNYAFPGATNELYWGAEDPSRTATFEGKTLTIGNKPLSAYTPVTGE